MRTAETLLSFRKRIGYTQSELSKLSGVNQAYISAIELGTRDPSKDTISKLAEAMGLTSGVVFVYAADFSDIEESKKPLFKELSKPMLAMIDEMIDIKSEEVKQQKSKK